MPDTEVDTTLVVLKTAAKAVTDGTVSTLADLVKMVAPPAELPKVPEQIPLPAEITKAQQAALERLAKVYGSVVPTERRRLIVGELALLRAEWETLAEIEKLAKERKESIRTSILNDLDVKFEAQLGRDDDGNFIVPEGIYKQHEGHWVQRDASPAGEGQEWSWEPRSGSSDMDAAKLAILAASEDLFPEFTHKDYLAMTEQVRMVDPNRVMLHLKKRPELIGVIRAASKSSAATAALALRKLKKS